MKANFTDGQIAFTNRLIPGTSAGTGTEVTIVETYSARGEETRYLVRSFGGAKFYVYESDLDVRDPLSRLAVCPKCRASEENGFCPTCRVDLSDPCHVCGQAGYHADGCAESDATINA
jgi:hypothetical protein